MKLSLSLSVLWLLVRLVYLLMQIFFLVSEGSQRFECLKTEFDDEFEDQAFIFLNIFPLF